MNDQRSTDGAEDGREESSDGARHAPALGPELSVERLGRVPYEASHAHQRAALEQRVADRTPDRLILLEHEEVVTLGRKTKDSEFGRAELERAGLPVVDVERGGEATWHGPGQLVAYPVVRLPEGRRDLHQYLRDLEQVVIDVLAELGVTGSRREGLTGVWIGLQKVSSIGVAVRRWTTWHGVSLNVTNASDRFATFRPCGLDPGTMTRVADHAVVPAGDALLERVFERRFRAVFGYPVGPESAR